MSYKLLAKVEIQEDKSEDAVINAILGACTKRLIGQLQGLEKKWREVTGVVQGLAFLHTSVKQVIYRDFKCSNILLDGSYNAKLSDFGLGGFHGDSEIMGTYGYAAPEYMALGGFASNNKTAVGMNIVTNKEASQKSEDPEVSFIIEINTGNTSMCQIKEATKGNDDNPKTNHAKHKRKEKMGRFSSSLATLTFPLFMFLTILGHPLKETQGYHSILVCLLAMFNLIAFIFAVSVMILVRARFTWMQITIMLISGMAIPVAHSNLLMEAPILTISLLWNAQVITSPI